MCAQWKHTIKHSCLVDTFFEHLLKVQFFVVMYWFCDFACMV